MQGLEMLTSLLQMWLIIIIWMWQGNSVRLKVYLFTFCASISKIRKYYEHLQVLLREIK